jgi:Bacteriophage tail sheath protein
VTLDVSYPGVYIQEFTPAPPIQGVTTSVTALLGPAPSGPILQPTLITNWDQFKQVFGAQPLPGYYLWYAVQGFFQNGGQILYVVRISDAAYATVDLLDGAGSNVIAVQALRLGTSGNSINITVTHTSALANLHAFRHGPAIATAAGTVISFGSTDDAIQFRPGDTVIVAGDPSHRATVVLVSGKTVTLSQPLPAAAPAAVLELPDLIGGQDTVIRFTDTVDTMTYLAPGTYLSIGDGVSQETVTVKSVTVETIMLSTSPPPLITYRVNLTKAVVNNYSLATLAATSEDFDLHVASGATTETHTFLSMEPTSPRYYASQINATSGLITVAAATPPAPEAPPNNRPAAATVPLTGGVNENLTALGPADYQNGLDSLLNVDVDIVAIPDAMGFHDPTGGIIQTALLDHCQGAPPRVGDRFAILDSKLGDDITGVSNRIQPLASFNGFGALYYPWVLVPPAPPPPGSPPPAVAPPNLLVPPSGHLAGLYARIDNSRGVFKAPAGLEAGLQGTIGVETVLTDTQQGLLNMTYGVNVIRVFKGGQPTVWGARTTAVVASNTNWQYVNIRRLFLFLEQSISQGIRFAVFEPNNTSLWSKLTRSISAFLKQAWIDGALFGATAKEAFYVRIDDALNPPDQMALGILTIEIGVRPSYPAEFIIVRIGIWDGGTSVSEAS